MTLAEERREQVRRMLGELDRTGRAEPGRQFRIGASVPTAVMRGWLCRLLGRKKK